MRKIGSILRNDILKIGPGFGRRAVIITLVEILTGFFLSFLINVDLGTDPCTFMNLQISSVLGISFGSWQFLMNAMMFVIVIAASRFRHIGIGTIANMVCIGYSSDFCRWVWGRTIPEDWFKAYPGRVIFFVIGLVGFILCCAIYMNYEMGLSPYDALPVIIGSHLKRVPFTIVRMCWDFGIIGIGCLLGGRAPLGTLILAFALGPTVSVTGRMMKKLRL